MAKDFAHSFYRSKRWLATRESYIGERVLIDGAVCEHCKARPGYIVDHIEELTPENIWDPTISLGHGNLQYLCLPCHNTKTHGTARVQFDQDGDPVL